LEQTLIKKLTDLPIQIENFIKDKIDYSSEILVWKKSTPEKTKEVLNKLRSELEKIEENDFVLETIEKKVMNFIESQSLGNGDVLWPFRVALSGKDKSPGPYEIADALGKEMTLDRLNTAISKL
jgi:glutamyl/glutaminyl-tRNA synthetase